MPKNGRFFRIRLFTAFGLAALALWAAIAFALQAAEREALQKAGAEGRNLARSLAEHVGSSVRALDLVLLHLREEWIEAGATHFSDAVAEQRKHLEPEFIIPQVTAIAANGRVAYSNLPGWQGVDLSDRQHFKVHKETGTDALHISEPVLGRVSKLWTIQFTRPIRDRQQRFAGVMVLSVPPPALERVYNDIELDAGARIVLVRSDGRILAHSQLGKAAEVSLADSPALGPDAAPAGEYRRAARTDGIERLYRYQKVPGYPLTVFVGQSVESVLAPIRVRRATYLAAGALATALLLAITLLISARRRTREETDRHRVRIEADLRTQTERLLIGQRTAKLIIMDWDILKDELSWSDSPEWLRGPLPEAGKYPLYIEQVHPEDRDRFRAIRAGGIDTLQPHSYEYRIVRTDGRILWVRSRRVVLPGADGNAARMLVALQDITEGKQAEDSIRKLNEELERRVQERTGELSAANAALRTEIGERRLAEIAAMSLADRLQGMARRLGEAQEHERRRLAAELHDGVCSNLAAIGLNLALLQKQLPHSDMASMQQRFSALITLIDEAKANAKDISIDLRPLLLQDRDLRSALDEYGRKFEVSTGIAVAVRGTDCGRLLQAEEKIALFRITQEALTNCAKHAHARAVAIELHTAADHLSLSIADDGAGFDLTEGNGKAQGLGLLSMQERAEAIGGRWRIESSPGKGTRVIVEVAGGAL